ncbi:hypothetical protein [Clostridium peptidivorans]|uniref:hypothetical protein n=1 Tax=Clostridium peptidivorans TaxID=100174 RepID=UPI000BE3BDC4|nr:hypothetical protein [Clostridium peptidivorans]
MKLEYYYWGRQCPIIDETLSMLPQYEHEFEIKTYNIEKDFTLAEEQSIYFPFLTVVNDTFRYFSPLTHKLIQQIKDGLIKEEPYIIPLGETVYSGTVVPLTKDNIGLICPKCTMTDSYTACEMKSIFLRKYCNEIMGFLNMENGQVLGGVEFLPSEIVPYNIPKSEKYAFITCVYHSSTEFDYKKPAMDALLCFLKGSYTKVFAISDEEGTFPNGDLKWFLNQGFCDEGIISIEDNYCTLHLVSCTL